MEDRLNGHATGSNRDTDGFDWQTGSQENKTAHTNRHDDETSEVSKKETRKSTPAQEIDLDDYRAGRSLKLAGIATVPGAQKIEIRRPKKNEWFRCHSTEDLERVYLFEGDGINDFYLVRRDIAAELPDEFIEVYMVLCVNSSGRLFLWPIKIGDGGQEFTEAALTHASQARAIWARRRWIQRLKTHRLEVNDMEEAEPEWPEDLSMPNILTKAFADKVIRSLDHPCIRFAQSMER